MGHELPHRRARSGGFPIVAGRVGSDQEVFDMSQIGSDQVGSGGFE